MVFITVINFITGCQKDPLGVYPKGENRFNVNFQWAEQTEPPFLMGCEGSTFFLHANVESAEPVTITIVTEYFEGGVLIPDGPEPNMRKVTQTITLVPGRNEYVLILDCVVGKPKTVFTTDETRN